MRRKTKCHSLPVTGKGRPATHRHTQSLSNHPRFFHAKGNGLVRDVREQESSLTLNFCKCVHLPHSFPSLPMTWNASQCVWEDTLQENAPSGECSCRRMFLPRERGKHEGSNVDHKRREKKEGKEGWGQKGKEKEKGYQVVSASLLFFLLAKVVWQILRDGRACSLKTNWLSRPGLKASLITATEMLFFLSSQALWGSAPAVAIISWKVIRATSPFSLCIHTEALKHSPSLRLARPARGGVTSLLSRPFFRFPFWAHITLVSCSVPGMSLTTAFASDNFLEGAVTTLLSRKSCKPCRKMPATLFIELARVKADAIEVQSLLKSIFKWFVTITESQLICSNFHGGS